MPTLEESLKALQANPADEAARKNIRTLVDKDVNGVADSTEVVELAAITRKLISDSTALDKSFLISAVKLSETFSNTQISIKDPVTGLIFTPEAGKKVIQAVISGANVGNEFKTPSSSPTTTIDNTKINSK